MQNRHSRILLWDLQRGRVVKNAPRTGGSQRQKPKWENGSTAVQGLPQRNLHHSILWKWHPPECLFYKSENGCRFGEKCSYAHRQVDELPSKRGLKRMVTKVQWLEPPKSSSILRRSSNTLKPIRFVRFNKAVVRHANILDQNPSPGMISTGDPHQRNANAPKFEYRSQEETEWQERCAVKQRGGWPKISQKNKGKRENSILLTFGKLVPACAIIS